MVTVRFKGRRRLKTPRRTEDVHRILGNRLVNVRGARVYRYPLWTFGELAYITVDRDDAARSCAALLLYALPVHVRKGSPEWPFRLRHPHKIGILKAIV